MPILLSVAFITLIERKWLAVTQRRVGPNAVGFIGLLQPFADALKLIIKESITPGHSNKILFNISPIIALIFSLLNWSIIPFSSGLQLLNNDLSILITLALSSLGIYGVLLAGWSANSKYAIIGSLRSTAQIISYELILGSCVLIVAIIASSWNYNLINDYQTLWFIIPLIFLIIIFIITLLAESNRSPIDLVEDESCLVAGYLTEHSSVPFVIFFLAEYCSIVLLSSLISILFLGGFLTLSNPLFSSLIFGFKISICCLLFVWIRATLPRLRYDILIEFCWLELLPITIALVLLIPSILILI